MEQPSIESFRQKLEDNYSWPSLYTFKFIVPKAQVQKVRDMFVNHNFSEKASKNGNYISVTAQIMADSSDTVIEFYLKANKIEGMIAL